MMLAVGALLAVTAISAVAANQRRNLRAHPTSQTSELGDGLVRFVSEEADTTAETTADTKASDEDSSDAKKDDEAEVEDEVTDATKESSDSKPEAAPEKKKYDCSQWPFLKLNKVVLNNLGGKGPDTDREHGLIYDVAVKGGPQDGETFELHFNVTSPVEDFKPQSSKEIGFQGKYGSINIKDGSNVTLEIEKFDPVQQKHLPFGDFYFTFFDLDQGPNGEASESITVRNIFNAYIANQSEVNVTTLPDGSTMFSATKEGTGADNPKDPLHLTKQQFRKAVTVAVKDVDKLEVTLAVGKSSDPNPRWFNFRGQPTLLCVQHNKTLQEIRKSAGVRTTGGSVFVMLLGLFLMSRPQRQ